MSKNNIEIEKRYILRRLPNIDWDGFSIINQYYGSTGRLRHTKIWDTKFMRSKEPQKELFIRTLKKSISKGVNREIEVFITIEEFEKEVKKCTKHIRKTRYVKKVGKYVWEVDDFFDMHLIIAEVEVGSKKELKTVKEPKFIKNELIKDITGDKDFSNFNLSEKYKYIN